MKMIQSHSIKLKGLLRDESGIDMDSIREDFEKAHENEQKRTTKKF